MRYFQCYPTETVAGRYTGNLLILLVQSVIAIDRPLYGSRGGYFDSESLSCGSFAICYFLLYYTIYPIGYTVTQLQYSNISDLAIPEDVSEFGSITHEM